MNLKEHKEMLRQYEGLMLELRSMRKVQPDYVWVAETCGCAVPLPTELAHTLLREHLLSTEKKAREMAATLGFTFEFPAENSAA